jgi:hypothetical protein
MTYVILILLLFSAIDFGGGGCVAEENGARFINVVFYLIIVKYKLAIKKLEKVAVKCLKRLRKN